MEKTTWATVLNVSNINTLHMPKTVQKMIGMLGSQEWLELKSR
jgi:hypothetical protein